MTSKTPTNMNLTAATAELNAPEQGRSKSFESRRLSFTKHFKSIPSDGRKSLCESAALALKQGFENEESPDEILLLMISGIASEHDWDTTTAFLEAILRNVTNSESLQEIALSLLEIADNELSEDKRKLPYGQTALVMTTELGLLIANRTGKSSLDYRGMSRVVEYITSSLLARSNMNDTAMRISLVHYLARCPLNNQATSQLNRVMSRFGQSLLHELFGAYFEDKKRGNVAFHFLVQHLNIFFVASPSLSQMAHDVLKHYMLKFPDEFPTFLAGYCEHVAREEIRLAAITRHTALLVNAATEVSKRSLAESLGAVLVQTLEHFGDLSNESLESQSIAARQILSMGLQKPSSAMSVLEEIIENVSAIITDAMHKASGNVVSIQKAHKPKKLRAAPKAVRIGNEPSPLETILALAS